MDKIEPVARIDVISDAICPWCYIGKRNLEGALGILAGEGLHFAVMWHPFQLNPDMPAEGVERKPTARPSSAGPRRQDRSTSASPGRPRPSASSSISTG